MRRATRSVTASRARTHSTLPGGRVQQTERFNAVPDTVLTDPPGLAHLLAARHGEARPRRLRAVDRRVAALTSSGCPAWPSPRSSEAARLGRSQKISQGVAKRTILRHPPGQARSRLPAGRRLPENGVEKPACLTTPARPEGDAGPGRNRRHRRERLARPGIGQTGATC